MTPQRREPWKAILSCALAVSLTACSTGRSQYAWHDLGVHQPADVAKVSPPSQRWGKDAEGPGISDPAIAPGFLLSLRSSDDNKLNGEFRVDADGILALPYDVTLNTAGMTQSSLERKLSETYKPYFKTTAGIKVRVLERRYWVDLRGLVDKPGRYLVEQTASLDQLVSLAGGFAKDSPPRFIRIQKGQKSLVLDLNQYMNKGDERSQIAAWYGGEVLFFQRDIFAASPTASYRLPVYIMGEVRKPGEYTAKPGTDFVDLVTQASGFTELADLKHIEVIRRSGGRQYAYEFAWNNFARAPALAEGDVVFVHSDTETRVERRISIAAGVLSALAAIATAGIIADRLR